MGADYGDRPRINGASSLRSWGKAGCTRLESGLHLRGAGCRREDQDLGAGEVGTDGPGRLDAVEVAYQPVVQDHDVRTLLHGQLDDVPATAGHASDHAQALLCCQRRRQPFGEQALGSATRTDTALIRTPGANSCGWRADSC